MESSTLTPQRRWTVDWRLIGIVLVSEAAIFLMAVMVVNRPLVAPKLTRDEALQHWPAALIGAGVVVLGVLFVVRETIKARGQDPAPVADAVEDEADRPRVPRSLGFELTSKRTLALAAALSLSTIPLAILLDVGLPLWWLAFLVPWIPIVIRETRNKWARDALFTGFGMLVVLQLLHMVEHSVQVGQLYVHNGELAKSHGIFGQLDFELVHFVTDSTLWISLGLLVIIFRGRNLWLVVAFAAASLHQVEHNYLFWLDHADNDLYLAGGAAGIMGKFGLIGSPLDRPYLHYSYNFIVFLPMVIAVWDEARAGGPRALRAAKARGLGLEAPRAASISRLAPRPRSHTASLGASV